MLVDPRTGGVVATAASSSSHPLKHAVMLCIDAVACNQGGGSWGAPLLEGNENNKEVDSGTATGETTMEQIPPEKKRRLDSYLCSEYDIFVSREPCVM